MGKGRDDDVLKMGGACCTCTILLVSVILFAVSFDTLEPTEVGIKYNNNLKSIDQDRVYNNGRYFLGLGLSFITYDMNLQLVEFKGAGETGALRAWSSEGQLITIDLSFMYRLRRDKVVQLYRRYENSYQVRFRQIAVRSIKQVSIQYSGEDFFTRRVEIGAHMRRDLSMRLSQEFVLVEMFNLRNIAIPVGFENKIVEKVVMAQKFETARNLKQIAQLRAKVSVVSGTGLATVKKTLAVARAKAVQIVEQAKSTGAFLLRQREALSYQELAEALDLSAGQVLRYRYSQIADRLEKDDTTRNLEIMVGFGQPVLNVASGTPGP